VVFWKDWSPEVTTVQYLKRGPSVAIRKVIREVIREVIRVSSERSSERSSESIRTWPSQSSETISGRQKPLAYETENLAIPSPPSCFGLSKTLTVSGWNWRVAFGFSAERMHLMREAISVNQCQSE
jgi:hypothetical protein